MSLTTDLYRLLQLTRAQDVPAMRLGPAVPDSAAEISNERDVLIRRLDAALREERPLHETHTEEDAATEAVERFREALAAHFEREAGNPLATPAQVSAMQAAAAMTRAFQPPA